MESSNQEINDRRQSVIANSFTSVTQVYAASAEGAIIVDVEGKQYIDFAGGIGAMNIGHSHPKIIDSIKKQAEQFTHTCFMVTPYDSVVKLGEILCQNAPGESPKKAYFTNSGAEAVENAVKIARHYTKRPGVVVFENAYHGRTLLTMAMTNKSMPFKKGFGPFAPEVYRIPFGDTRGADQFEEYLLKYVDPDQTAVVVAEPVQGEGGFICPPMDYFQKVSEVCRKYGILFAVDEIQSGMGRTGKLFAIEHWGVEPDLLIVGKSLAAGMPLSGVVGKKGIMDEVHPGGLGGTYGGNPIAVSAALAVFDIFKTENMLEKSVKLGEKLSNSFSRFVKDFDNVGEVKGLGAMLGFTVVQAETGEPDPNKAKALVNYCIENGLIILVSGMHGNLIRCLAPFTITDEQLEKALNIIETGLAEIHKQNQIRMV
jgi:4-aminobutyrate aminotransferase/(S)-3-amino-2-methylpropionate transaminase